MAVHKIAVNEWEDWYLCESSDRLIFNDEYLRRMVGIMLKSSVATSKALQNKKAYCDPIEDVKSAHSINVLLVLVFQPFSHIWWCKVSFNLESLVMVAFAFFM